MRFFVRTLMVMAGVMLPAGVAMAQGEGTFERQQRQYEELLRRQLDRPASAPEQKCATDWGGWFNFAVSTYEDETDEMLVYRRYDLYLWGRAIVDYTHEFYARGRFSLLDFNNGDDPDGRDEDWQGPYVDRLFYSFDLRKGALRRDKKNLDYNAFGTIGRQYVQFGTGLALSLPMDAVLIGGELGNVEVTGLLGRTIKSYDNFDLSPPVASHSDRCVYGIQAAYRGLKDHEPFAYYFWQKDGTDESPDDPQQEYDYDSRYLGIGSRGRLVLPNLYYQTELVWEQGRSYGVGATQDQDPICAIAYDLGLTYLFDGPHRPQVSFEYLFASGDEDRTGLPTSTLGGNRAGTTDHGFVGLGFRNTGLAFAPPISNLHMFRLGGVFRPLPNYRLTRELEFGADFFGYMKAESEAAGPEFRTRTDGRCLGEELDIFANWRLTSDLLWTIRYGVFFPGDAFSGTRSARNFLFTGLTFSF